MTKRVSIANAAGFLGDQLAAPRRLVESARVDYLTLEYLAELTLSILARQREKNAASGYAEDFVSALGSITPALSTQPRLKVITNGGGMNPASCARAAAQTLVDAGRATGDLAKLSATPIGVVSGDDLLSRIAELQAAGCALTNLDTGAPLSSLGREVVAANAYLGARPITDALAAGSRIVVTGRVADASLTVGPAMHEFGWRWDDWNRLAAASVAGHLIECGAQVTGGLYRHWQSLDLANVGYPIAEVEASGRFTITKPAGSGGQVSRATVIEQLVYEIGDPRHYLTPDVDVDFTSLTVSETGADRVVVEGAAGAMPPDQYKVSLAYRDGFAASGQLLIWGEDCLSKAEACGQMILDRVAQAGFSLARVKIECLGAGQSALGVGQPPRNLREVMLRVSVHDDNRPAVERFTREFAPLVTTGPPGIAGYASGRAPIRPVFAYWPTLVPKDFVAPMVEVRPANEWIG